MCQKDLPTRLVLGIEKTRRLEVGAHHRADSVRVDGGRRRAGSHVRWVALVLAIQPRTCAEGEEGGSF